MLSVKKQRIVLFPYFQDWHAERRFVSPVDDLHQLAEHMGFISMDDVPCMDIKNVAQGELEKLVKQAYPGALVDPFETVSVQKLCTSLAMHSASTTEELKALYYTHYDSQKTKIDAILAERWVKMLKAKNVSF